MDHKFKKKWGQNFINDTNVLKKIVRTCPLEEDDLVIEIGSGSGNLSLEIINTGASLISFEIDESLKDHLEERFKGTKASFYFMDFLKADLNSILKNYEYNNLYLIANIPYYITTKIIKKVLEEEINVKALTLLMQKEVGDRITAKPKHREYGSLTVILNYYFEINREFNVNRKVFYPIPKVDSTVLTFKRNNRKYDKEFNDFIYKCFKQKRKTLSNNLNIKMDSKVRAEELSLEELISLYERYNDML